MATPERYGFKLGIALVMQIKRQTQHYLEKTKSGKFLIPVRVNPAVEVNKFDMRGHVKPKTSSDPVSWI